MRFQLTTLVLAMALVGCQEDREPIAAPVVATQPAPAAAQRVAFLSVSSLMPDTGSTIVVAGNVGSGESSSIASFVVRLAYDATALHYVREVQLPGMMRVVNPREIEIIVAAASGSGSSDGRLFAVEFRVDDPAGLSSLVLVLNEVNDREFNSQLSSITQSSTLVLDKKLTAGRSTPR